MEKFKILFICIFTAIPLTGSATLIEVEDFDISEYSINYDSFWTEDYLNINFSGLTGTIGVSDPIEVKLTFKQGQYLQLSNFVDGETTNMSIGMGLINTGSNSLSNIGYGWQLLDHDGNAITTEVLHCCISSVSSGQSTGAGAPATIYSHASVLPEGTSLLVGGIYFGFEPQSGLSSGAEITGLTLYADDIEFVETSNPGILFLFALAFFVISRNSYTNHKTGLSPKTNPQRNP